MAVRALAAKNEEGSTGSRRSAGVGPHVAMSEWKRSGQLDEGWGRLKRDDRVHARRGDPGVGSRDQLVTARAARVVGGVRRVFTRVVVASVAADGHRPLELDVPAGSRARNHQPAGDERLQEHDDGKRGSQDAGHRVA